MRIYSKQMRKEKETPYNCGGTSRLLRIKF
jgi:hypothetical protein